MLMSKKVLNAPLYALVVSCLLPVGCAKEEEEEEEAAGELAGTWSTACISKERDSGEIESYSKKTLVFTEASMTTEMSDYDNTDTTCAGTPLYSINETNTFTVGADVTTPAGAKILDWTPSKVEATIKTAGAVNQFNGNAQCGFSDWTINVAKDVSTAACGGQALNSAVYNIYDVDGTSLKTGELTTEGAGGTAALRPTALSVKDHVYTKQ